MANKSPDKGAISFVGTGSFLQAKPAAETTYRTVPGTISITPSPSTREEVEQQALIGSYKGAGAVTIGNWDLEMIWGGRDKSTRDFKDAFDNSTQMDIRVYTDPQILVPQTAVGVTAAIAAATGLVTFVGYQASEFLKAKFYSGMQVKIGANYYTVDEIDATTGALTVQKPSANVTAAPFSIVKAQLRWEFTCSIQSEPVPTFSGTDFNTSTVTLVPTAIVSQPEAVETVTA